MKKVKERIDSIVKGIEVGFECKAEIDYGAMYHQVYNNEQITSEFIEFVKNETTVNVIECKEAMTGEDFGYMLEKIPGLMFWLGVESEYGLHHAKLNPNENAIETAINLLIAYLDFRSNRE